MSKKTVFVTIEVEVDLDESKFTEQFMQDFRDSFFPIDTIDEHRMHLAQMFARGIYDNGSSIEGYGLTESMGIKFDHISTETEIV